MCARMTGAQLRPFAILRRLARGSYRSARHASETLDDLLSHGFALFTVILPELLYSGEEGAKAIGRKIGTFRNEKSMPRIGLDELYVSLPAKNGSRFGVKTACR